MSSESVSGAMLAARVAGPRTAAWGPVVIAALFFSLAIATRPLYSGLPVGLANDVWKGSWLLWCGAGLWAAHRVRPRRLFVELGLGSRWVRGLGRSLLWSLPMLVGLAWFAPAPPVLELRRLWSGAVLAAFSEETLFRGYLVRQLVRHGGQSVWASILISACLFGVAHAAVASDRGLATVATNVGVTAVGGALFAWLFVRWEDDLWVPIGLHGFMNAWWDLFAVDVLAIGGQNAGFARGATVAAAIIWTLLFTAQPAAARPFRGGGLRLALMPVAAFLILQVVLLRATDGDGGFRGLGVVVIGLVGTPILAVLNLWVIRVTWAVRSTAWLAACGLPGTLMLGEALWVAGPSQIAHAIDGLIVAPFVGLWLLAAVALAPWSWLLLRRGPRSGKPPARPSPAADDGTTRG